MLQQTTVSTVTKRFEEFVKKWPTINKLSDISESKILSFWSGLGYYSSAAGTIPVYSCLVFKFSCFQMEINDHDNDNVPSYLEDLNGNLNLTDDADDTDGDTFYDFVDSDDDNDGTLTIDEDLEPDTDLSVDRDGEGDPTNDIGDGDTTNDDTDGDGIPNYLDPDDSDSRNEG